MAQGCHNCPSGPGDWCFKCRRVDFDDIAISKTSHLGFAQVFEVGGVDAGVGRGVGGASGKNKRTCQRDVWRLMVREFSELPLIGAAAMWGKLRGMSLSEVGRALKITRQAVDKVVTNCCAKYRWYAHIYKAFPKDKGGRKGYKVNNSRNC